MSMPDMQTSCRQGVAVIGGQGSVKSAQAMKSGVCKQIAMCALAVALRSQLERLAGIRLSVLGV